MTIQIAKTRPMTDTARCIRDSMVNAGIRSTWPLRELAEYAGMEMDNTEFIVTQMELAGYIKKTHWGHYMLTAAGIEAL
ncbi:MULTISPECIES: hypothetical protein [Lelliottia]|uniref:Uncharacterized protein n=1 Tax=Lelliottia aquatilis TaxID=2080838 RepID=A0ABX5A2Z5_9ENTR|nr:MULTISPECIES: hypothetical protein [Lelliottia]POZ15173.1 hypothetical protein C3Z09_15960 [Lelliottia aquatilis]POZ24033.1 hypothetical protein C3712_07405 [Lelliottia aquatilis]POZ27565.1 hypothetical protein C3708_08250 [Lelliottia sp. 7254-16]POZ29836.1 hypothetical protein C3711_01460 [Lelliottia aquatilis]POZ35401.1 hypothetical protein C3710_01460 [Lelliottia aquatilis]